MPRGRRTSTWTRHLDRRRCEPGSSALTQRIAAGSPEADGKPVGEEAWPVARLLRRSPDGVDFVVLIEMVGASAGHPRIVNRLLDLQIGAISQVADVNNGHQDLRVVTKIHPLALFVDGLPPYDERSPRALGRWNLSIMAII